MSLVAQLQLNDVVAPEPVSWWPPAPGWWILAGLSIAALIVAAVLGHRWLSRRNRQRIGMQALDRLWQHCRENQQMTEYLPQANLILKRHCVLTGQHQAAKLSGADWQQYLKTYVPAAEAQQVEDFCRSIYLPPDQRPLQADLQHTESQHRQIQRWLRRLPC